MTTEQLAFVEKQRTIFKQIVETAHLNNDRILPYQSFDPGKVYASDLELLTNTGQEQMVSLVVDRIKEAKMAKQAKPRNGARK